MNIAAIFAGGVGRRMNVESTPKQFLELHGKAIIIHTVEHFQHHPNIDGIVIACVDEWTDHLRKLLARFGITKVREVVPGGATGQASIYSALCAAERHYPSDSVVLIHDGVRPLITSQVIDANIAQVKASGSAITTAPTVETFMVTKPNMSVQSVPDRRASRLAKAPQSFTLSEILAVHRQAQKDGISDSIDSCTLMHRYGKTLSLVEGPRNNIKITTREDYFVFRALVDAKENKQIYGLDA